MNRDQLVCRAATKADREAIRAVHLAAFGGSGEADLVAALDRAGALAISVVACIDAGVVGHIAFSPITVEQETGYRLEGLGLAPLAVLPAHQRHGIGSQLVRAGLDACRKQGEALVVVLGDPEYYARFGFVMAANHDLHWEHGGGSAFQVLATGGRTSARASGIVRYRPEFEGL